MRGQGGRAGRPGRTRRTQGPGGADAAATEAGDALGASDLGHQLHRRIQEISGQVTALRTIERLRGQLVRHQFRLALRPGRARQSLAEHAALVEAVASGDPAAAEAAMREHLRQVARELGPTPSSAR